MEPDFDFVDEVTAETEAVLVGISTDEEEVVTAATETELTEVITGADVEAIWLELAATVVASATLTAAEVVAVPRSIWRPRVALIIAFP